MSNTYSKLAASGILLFGLATLWFIAGDPYVDLWQDRIAKAERLQRKQNSLRQLIHDRPGYEQQYRAVSGSKSRQAVFLDDSSGALADARLQRIIKQAASDSGVKLLQAVIANTRSASKKDAGGETEVNKAVTIKVLVQGSIESIYSMLRTLDNGRPVVVIANLQVTHQKSRRPLSPLASATSYNASYDATAFTL
jgi:general secretion pathway protein M